MIFWPVLGGGHLVKFRARAENRKTQFPGARGTFGEKNRPPQKFLPKSVQLFYILRFDRPDPQGQEIAKYWGFRPFGLGQPLGTSRNSGPKTKKRDFPELGALLGKQPDTPKVLPEKRATFLHFAFRSIGPPGTGNRKILGF